MNRRLLFRLGLPVLALAALASAALSVGRSNVPAGAPSSLADAPTPRLEGAVVAALGRVEPEGGLRSIASELPGTLAELAVTVGAQVEVGDVLFRLDDRSARRAIAEREAELATARAGLAQTRAQTGSARAELAAADARATGAEARLAELERDLDVSRLLSARDATAGRDVERRRAQVAQARAELDAARADVLRAEAELARLDPVTGADQLAALAAVAEAEQRLRSAYSDLDALAVTARTRGRIVSVTLREGETVSPSTPVLTLAGGGGTLLRVFVNEVDFGRVDTGRPGLAVPRGWPGAPIALSHVTTDPEVRPNRDLSGRADELIDTRVVELLYRLPPDANALIGQTFDVTLPALPVATPVGAVRDPADTVARSG